MFDEDLDKGKVLENYLLLKGLQRAYYESDKIVDHKTAKDLQEVIDLLTHLSSENSELKERLMDMEQRIKCLNNVFGGSIQ